MLIGQQDGAGVGKELSYLLLSDVIRKTLEDNDAGSCSNIHTSPANSRCLNRCWNRYSSCRKIHTSPASSR